MFGEQEAEHVNALTHRIKQLGGTPVAKPHVRVPGDRPELVPEAGIGAREHRRGRLQRRGAVAARASRCSQPPGSIVQIEARHAAAIDLLIGKSPTPSGGFDVPLTKAQVLAKAGPLIKA